MSLKELIAAALLITAGTGCRASLGRVVVADNTQKNPIREGKELTDEAIGLIEEYMSFRGLPHNEEAVSPKNYPNKLVFVPVYIFDQGSKYEFRYSRRGFYVVTDHLKEKAFGVETLGPMLHMIKNEGSGKKHKTTKYYQTGGIVNKLKITEVSDLMPQYDLIPNTLHIEYPKPNMNHQLEYQRAVRSLIQRLNHELMK